MVPDTHDEAVQFDDPIQLSALRKQRASLLRVKTLRHPMAAKSLTVVGSAQFNGGRRSALIHHECRKLSH